MLDVPFIAQTLHSCAHAEERRKTYVIRRTPRLDLAVLGRFGVNEITRLKACSRQLRFALEHVRYVDYSQVERDCEALADRLINRFEHRTLANASFTGIPRGGLIVLGMLSYILDLDHAQIEGAPPSNAPLIVVDDCALTGSRFYRFIQQYPDREIIFAPLYAHPDLCSAIEQAEQTVHACLSTRDLHDHAPDVLGKDYEGWLQRWESRPSEKRYWIGQPDHICFPWNEPDTGVWNPETEQIELGPRVVPPARCLKNRHAVRSTSPTDSIDIQVQPEPSGPIRPAPPVFFGTLGEAVIVAHPEADVCIELNGTAASMWTALVEHGTLAGALEALLSAYDVDQATLETDLNAFVQSLAARDLLHVPSGTDA